MPSFHVGSDFAYNMEEYTAVNIHQGGYLTFNGSSISSDLDCQDARIFEEDDTIVALCSREVFTLVSINFLLTQKTGKCES